MKTLTREKKEAIFLALTKIHRDINNNVNPSFHRTFRDCGFKNSSMVAQIRAAMIKMNIIRVKEGITYWNSEKTLPNPKLVDGILLTIKEMRRENIKSDKVEVKINVTPNPTVSTALDTKEDSLESILKNIMKAGINPNIIIIYNK